MPDQLVLIFSKDNIQQLMDTGPDKIVIRAYLEAGKLEGGENIGYLKVYADAIQEGEPEPLHTVSGCPKPPCDM